MSVRPNVPATIRIQDFSGGKNTTISPPLLNDNEAVECINTSFLQKGTISLRKGKIKRYQQSFSPTPVTGLGALYLRNGTTRLLSSSGTSIFSDSPNISTSWQTSAEFATGTLEGGVDFSSVPNTLRALPVPATNSQEASTHAQWGTTSRTNIALEGNSVVLAKIGQDVEVSSGSVSLSIPQRASAQLFNKNLAEGSHSSTQLANGVVSLATSGTTQAPITTFLTDDHAVLPDWRRRALSLTSPPSGTVFYGAGDAQDFMISSGFFVEYIRLLTSTGSLKSTVVANPITILALAQRVFAERTHNFSVSCPSVSYVAGDIIEVAVNTRPNGVIGTPHSFLFPLSPSGTISAGNWNFSIVVGDGNQSGGVGLFAYVNYYVRPQSTISNIVITAPLHVSSGVYTTAISQPNRNNTFVNNGVVTWTQTTPAGTAVQAEYRLLENGTPTTAWIAVSNGGAIPPSPQVQLRFNLSTSVPLNTPSVSGVSISYVAELHQNSSHDFPNWNSFAVTGGMAVFTLTLSGTIPTGTSVSAVVTPQGGAPIEVIAGQPYQITGTNFNYSVTLTSNSQRTLTPNITGLLFSFVSPRHLTGEVVLPVWDTRNFHSTSGTLVASATTPLGSVVYSIRSSADNVTWSGWTTVLSGGAVTLAPFLQQRAVFTVPNFSTVSPQLNSLAINFINCVARAVWISPVVDITAAVNKALNTVTWSGQAGSGGILVRSQSSTTGSAPWSPWSVMAADGTLTHSPTSFYRIEITITGNAFLNAITTFSDGLPVATVLVSGRTNGAPNDFTMYRNSMIMSNGVDPPLLWEGVGAPVNLGGSPPRFLFTESHQNRLWGTGSAETPSRVNFSAILDPNNWNALNFLDFNPDDGDRITAIVRYGDNLVVSKRRSMALLTGDRPANFSVTWLEGDFGAQGQRAICAVDKYLAFVAQDGVRFTDFSSNILAINRLLPSWEKINRRRLDQAAMVYWQNLLLVALPLEGSTVNNTVWVFDTLRNSWAQYDGWSISSWLKFTQYGEEVLLAGDATTGQVYQMLSVGHDDGQPIDYVWHSKDFHFGFPERIKLFRNLFFDLEGSTLAENLLIEFFVDGVKVGETNQTVPAGDGAMTTIRLLPPMHGAVLGQRIALRLTGRSGIHGIALEFIVRGAVPGGL